MMWVISIWLSVSLAIGMLGHSLLDPAGMLPGALMFALPFVLFGPQERLRSPHAPYRLFRIELFSSTSPYRQVTFWGIPISRERQSPDTRDAGDEPSEHVLLMMRALMPSIVNLVLGRLLLPDPRSR